MDTYIEKAKELLIQGDYTCVIMNDQEIYTSKERGVKPLLDWIDRGIDCTNSVVADKVVGKAAAFLYVILGVSRVYAGVLSEPAYKVLEAYNIGVSYGQKVSAIRNRDNTGFCPMESSVWDINNPSDARMVILQTRDRLMQKK